MAENISHCSLHREDGDLAYLTLDNPPANAVTIQMKSEMLRILDMLAREESPPGLVLSGAGDRFFCAGGDIREVRPSDPEMAVDRIRQFHKVLCALEQYPAPIVAAARGYAVGGGFEFLLFADCVIAGRNASFGFPEINHGLLPAAKGMAQAQRLLGQRNAGQLLYSGNLMSVERAQALGIVNEVVDVADVQRRATEVCKDLRSKDVKLFAAMKRTLISSQLDDAQLEELSAVDMRSYVARPETAEARQRFLDRKK